MARVPTYGGQQVLPEVLPAARVSSQGAADMQRGAQALAGGMNAAAKTAAQWALEEQEKVNDAAIMAYKNALSGIESDLLNHPETGAYAQKGQNAFGVRERTLPEWDRRQGEALAALPRHLQAQAKALADDKRIQIDNGLMRHTLAESTRYRDEQAAAMVENAGQAALLHWEDETRLGEELGNMDAAIGMRMRGAPAEAIAAEQAKAKSAVMSGVFNRHLLRDPLAANDWLDKRRDLFTGEDMMKAEAALQPYFLERSAGDEVKAWMAESQTGMADDAVAASLPVQGAAQTLEEVRQVAKQSLARTIRLESGGDPNAKNPKSSATGLGQFIESTWLNVIGRNRPDLTRGKTREQILALRTDPAIAKEMTEAYATENAIGLFNSGLPVTEQTVYWAHHFGLAGARRILSAPANTPMQQLLDAGSYAANPYLHGKTVGQVLANHQRRAGERTAAQPLPTRPANAAPDWVALKRRADELPNPLRRRAALAYINRQQSLAEEAEREEKEALNQRVYTAINRAQGNETLLQLVGYSDYAALEKNGQVPQLESMLEGKLKGSLVRSDIVLVDQLDRERILEPDKFQHRNIRELAFAGRLDNQDTERLLEAQQQLRDPGKRGQAMADWSTEEERLSQAERLLGIDDSKSEEKRATFRAQYRLVLQTFIQQNNGKKPTPTEMDNLVRNTLQSFAKNPDFYRQAATLNRIRSGMPFGEEENQLRMSQQNRMEIINYLREKGVHNPTEAEVMEMFLVTTSGDNKQ